MVGDGGYGERRRWWCSAVREREGAARERGGIRPGDRGGTEKKRRGIALAGRQADGLVAWRSGRAHAPATRLADWRQEDDGGGGLGWLAGPASWLGRTGRSPGKLLLLFPFLFSNF